MMEEWRHIKNYDSYKISNKGRIYSLHSNKIISFCLNKCGYPYVTLWKNNKRKRFNIHSLVARYFLENKQRYNEINHIDGNKLNNDVINLEWCSRGENIQHAYDNGLRKIPKGEINANSKLKEIDVKAIIKMLKNNISVSKISEQYNVTWQCINNIKSNKSWKHVERYD